MLTRFVRNQLIIFTIASVIGVTVMLFSYMQVPMLLGVGRIQVKLELPASGSLYRFSNVTYRGVQVGTVTEINATKKGAEATLTLDTSPKIPADLEAEVRSVSAIGEQYVDLRPRTDSAPYLADGSVIAVNNTKIPQAVGPMLDQVSRLVASFPKDRLSALLQETYKGLNGADYDFGSLLDSAATVTRDAGNTADQTRTLIDDSLPLLDSQAQTTDAIRTWTRSLAGITEQLAKDDPQVRTLLRDGPGFADEASRLLSDIKPTLPLLLANLTTIGQIGVTYNPSLEQILVLLPANIAFYQTLTHGNNGSGLPLGDFSMTISDPPPCTVGFLPPSSWRSPADESIIDTPDGLYCKLPQDSPIGVRGARNYPCIDKPGKRAPTAEICESDQPFEPLAQRQHILGVYPFDPNLISQGIPPDDRVLPDANIYGPIEGTPMPPGEPGAPSSAPSPLEAPIAGDTPPTPPASPANGAAPPGLTPPVPMGAAPGEAPPPPRSTPPVPAGDVPAESAPPPVDTPAVAPSSFSGRSSTTPIITTARYEPGTGSYVGADGRRYQQSNLATSATSWEDLLPR